MADEERPKVDAEYQKNLEDLGRLMLCFLGGRPPPITAHELNKQKSRLADLSGLDEKRLVEIYRWATSESQEIIFAPKHRKQMGFGNP